MSGIRIEGNASGNVAEVDANHNAMVNLPTVEAQAGYAVALYEQDDGALTGTRTFGKPEITENGRMSVGTDAIAALFNFTATAQNTGKFKHAFVTMTMTQSGGFLNINPGLATVSGNYAFLQSWRHFTLWGSSDTQASMTLQISAMPPANQVFEFGLFWGTAGVAPADGIFFRLTSAGLSGVMTYNGVETTTGVVLASVPINANAEYTISIGQRVVEFFINGDLAGTIAVPAGQAIPYLTLNLPFCLEMRNPGTVTGGCTVKVGTADVIQKEINTNKPWSAQMSTQGNSHQGQDGDTMGSLAQYSNAALAAAAALTNTTAAAGNTGLGGVALVLPTLTAGTDGILFSYQNPVGSVTQPPKTLVITGIKLDCGVQVALTGGPLTLVMGAAFGHTAVSLATAETGSFVTATTKAPRRLPLCIFSLPVTAAAGTGVTVAPIALTSPIVVNPGEFFAITCRNVGTVTSAGALAFTAGIDHYFE